MQPVTGCSPYVRWMDIATISKIQSLTGKTRSCFPQTNAGLNAPFIKRLYAKLHILP